MKQLFTFLAFQFVIGSSLLAQQPDDNTLPQKKIVKKHHFNWLVESQPIIGVGKYLSHQSISGPLALLLRPGSLDSTYKFVNTIYMGSFKGSVGYQYDDLIYVGLGTGIQFGRQIDLDSTKLISDIMVPFFADIRISFGRKVRGYYQQTAGYTLYFDQYLKQNDTIFLDAQHDQGVYRNGKAPWGGFFMQSSVGLKFDVKKISISAGLGYQLSYITENYTYYFRYIGLLPGYNLTSTLNVKEQDLKHHILFSLGFSL